MSEHLETPTPCPTCGYDLSGHLAADHCPECGRTPGTFIRKRRKPSYAVLALAILFSSAMGALKVTTLPAGWARGISPDILLFASFVGIALSGWLLVAFAVGVRNPGTRLDALGLFFCLVLFYLYLLT